jgi:hypothetical protein
MMCADPFFARGAGMATTVCRANAVWQPKAQVADAAE